MNFFYKNPLIIGSYAYLCTHKHQFNELLFKVKV